MTAYQIGVHRCIECIDDTLDILVYRKHRKHCDTQASIESIPTIDTYYLGKNMRTPVIKHNLLNFHRIIKIFFSECASGKKLAIDAKLVSVAEFV